MFCPSAQTVCERRRQARQQRSRGLQELRAQAARNLKHFTTDSGPGLDLLPAEPGKIVGGDGKIRDGSFTRGRLVPNKSFANLHPLRKSILPKRMPGSRGVATEHLGQSKRTVRQSVTSRQHGLACRGRQGIECGQQGVAALITEQMPAVKPQISHRGHEEGDWGLGIRG